MRRGRLGAAGGRRVARLAAVSWGVLVLTGTAARASCPGDCDGNEIVLVNELVLGVSIALGSRTVEECAAFDRNGDGHVSISELLAAVNSLLGGCPPLEPTPTASPSTELATPTETPNPGPILPTPMVYRAYPGFLVEQSLGVIDPDGHAVECAMEMLPSGATFDPPSGMFSWTPAADQLGPVYVPFSCMDGRVPPGSVAGTLTFAVAPLDACALPVCDPATGCSASLPPVTLSCCGSGPAASRVIEPVAGCPEGRVLYVGANTLGFGRLQNCDPMQLRVFAQAGAEMLFHIQTRCVNTNNRVRLRVRMESSSPQRRVLFDTELPPLFLDPNAPNGFAERRNLRLGINGNGPFFDLEYVEANLVVTLTDADGATVSEAVRVVLSATPHADLPDADPPLPTPTPR